MFQKGIRHNVSDLLGLSAGFHDLTLLDCFINLVSKFTNNFFGFSQSLNWESIFSNATVLYIQKLLFSQRVESLKLSTQNKNILKDFGRCFNALTIFSCPLSQLQRERVSMLDDPCRLTKNTNEKDGLEKGFSEEGFLHINDSFCEIVLQHKF